MSSPQDQPKRRRYDGTRRHKIWMFAKDGRNDIWTLLLTIFVAVALINSNNAQNKAKGVADEAAEKAKLSAQVAHDSCLRSQSAIPTIVKVMRAQQFAVKRFPDVLPKGFKISDEEIKVYSDLIPKSCP